MKRILLLVTLALMLAAAMALSGVAQARPIAESADAKCAKLAIKTLGSSFNPSNYTFIGGTEGEDNFNGKATAGSDVFCGYGGNDEIGRLDEGDIFLGGAGNDSVILNFGTINGGDGVDFVGDNRGTFNGGADNDLVILNLGTFNGGDGDDQANINFGTFNGGAGNDFVTGSTNDGTFNQD
jgi:hypothetical protein